MIAETPVYTLDGWQGNLTDAYGVDWIVEAEQGWSDAPEGVSQTLDRQLGDGSDSGDVLYGSRFITLSGTAVAPNRATMLTAKDRFAATCASRAGALLVVDEDHLSRQAWVKRVGKPKCEDLGDSCFRWELPLRADDLRKYAVQPSSATINMYVDFTGLGLVFPLVFNLNFGPPLSSASADLFNTGTFTTPFVITFTGPWTNPGVRHIAQQRSLDFDITLAAGEQLIVDTATTGSVLLNGSVSRINTIRTGSQWWLLQPGPNQVTVNGAVNPGANASFAYRSAWI